MVAGLARPFRGKDRLIYEVESEVVRPDGRSRPSLYVKCELQSVLLHRAC